MVFQFGVWFGVLFVEEGFWGFICFWGFGFFWFFFGGVFFLVFLLLVGFFLILTLFIFWRSAQYQQAWPHSVLSL